jgi:predicted enzyme related to lactoylglutathione lyase
MTAPNLFIVYVTDIERATNFYRDLFEIEPVMITPRYVPFEVAPGVIFALSNRGGEQVDPKTPRSFVVGLMVPRTEAAVDDVFAAWTAKGVTVAEEPHDEIYGRTFVITDPDGNPICVTPVD